MFLTLDIAIVTWKRDGIERVASAGYPRIHGVRWLVSWQCSDGIDIPAPLAGRDDVTVVRCDSVGISNNRNHALSHATADVVLLADDDLTYTAENIENVRRTFAAHPELDIATFRTERPQTGHYPSGECRLGRRLPKGYYVTSFEMAMRLPLAHSVRFSPMLGLGAPLMTCGEEEVVLHQAIRAGLDCRFFPLVIGRHDHPSTGTQAQLPDKVVRARGCVTRILYPYTWPLRIPLYAWRLYRQDRCPLGRAIKRMAEGARRAPAILSEYQ